MPMTSRTLELDNTVTDFYQGVRKHIELNILLKKWERKQKCSKEYWNMKFNHDGYLSEQVNNNVLYVINDKRTFLRIENEMQNYIKKNSTGSLRNSSVAYMYLNKTNNKNIDVNEYSRRYRKLILAQLNILDPVLIVVLDNSCNIISDILSDRRNQEMTRNTPILNMSPLDMSIATKRETLLFFKYKFDKQIERW